MFYDNLDRFGEKISLVYNNECITYVELQEKVNLIKKQLLTKGLLFSVCDNVPESMYGYLACLQEEVPVVMINNAISREMFDTLVQCYLPAYIWAPKAFVSDGNVIFSLGEYVLCTLNQNIDYEINSEIAVLLTTSGSTGSPKLVRQSRKNIQSNTESIIEYLGINSDDCAITTLPMHYTYGLSIVQTHIAAGATIVLTNANVIQPHFWELVKEWEVTTFGGVPYTYEMLNKIHFLNKDLPTLRYITQAGGRLGKELHLKFATGCKEKGIEFIVMYGQTEATARMSYVPFVNSIDKAGSIGIAIPGGKLCIKDDEGNDITEPRRTGELVYIGDNVTMGYAESYRDLNKGYDNGNVLFTGDMATFDEDGYFYIVGRKKRFLKLFGSRVNLDEVESILKSKEIDCAITGVDDKMVVYITRDDETEKVKDCIKENTTIAKFAYTIRVIEAIPRNEAGKILYSALEV